MDCIAFDASDGFINVRNAPKGKIIGKILGTEIAQGGGIEPYYNKQDFYHIMFDAHNGKHRWIRVDYFPPDHGSRRSLFGYIHTSTIKTPPAVVVLNKHTKKRKKMKTANQNPTYQKSTASNTLAKSTLLAQIPLAKFAFVCGLACIVCLFGACSSKPNKPKYVKDTKDYTLFGLDSHDIKKAVENSANSLMSSDFVKSLDGKKVIAISDIKNYTDEEIDIESPSSQPLSQATQ